MTLTIRDRIFLTLVPLLVLVVALGVAGMILLWRLGGRVDAILRENYDSIIAMEHLNEALERIDSSFQFTLAGEEAKARDQYRRTGRFIVTSCASNRGMSRSPANSNWLTS